MMLRAQQPSALGTGHVARRSSMQHLLTLTVHKQQQVLVALPHQRRIPQQSPCAAGAAASEQRSPSEPTYLSDLIVFESDQDGSSGSDSADVPGGGPSSHAAEGAEAADPTVRAQDIINRATEVLAAARAALAAPSTAAAAAADGGDGRRLQSGGTATAFARPPPAAVGGQSSTGTSGSSSSSSPGSNADGGEALTRRWSPLSEDQDLTRHVLQSALDQMQQSGAPIADPRDADPFFSASWGDGAARAAAKGAGSSSSSSSSSRRDRDIRKGRGGSGADGGAAAAADGHGPAPSWAQSLLGSDDFSNSGYNFPSSGLMPVVPSAAGAFAEPQLQLQQAADRPSAWGWEDESFVPLKLPPAALGLLSQSAIDAEKARATTVLPPLQSVLELTTAFRPPERTGAVTAAPAPAAASDTATATSTATDAEAVAPVGRALPDGSGRLADGTWWEKKSGVEYGKNGYWKRWQLLKGGNAEGTLEWEETWWEASDWTGLKEMGAEKKGRNTDGAAWRENWSERLAYASKDLDCVVERNAHKWAADASGDEWEEKWGEHYHVSGKVAKFADKWGKAGPNVWHERWGEDYDATKGDACVKWTDKWAERLLPGGAREQWGDKWHEAFANGRGEKNGEVWSVAADGGRYQRWWGEHHLGDRNVRRFGHSTTGESWDDTITMDTYYNPVPHFGFKLALDHSPQLRGVPMQPKPINEQDPFGPGLDEL